MKPSGGYLVAAMGAGGALVRPAATTAASVAGRMSGPARRRAGQAGDSARRRAGQVISAAAAAADLGTRRRRRRVWAGAGRAHVEVRGLTGRGTAHRRLARDVTSELNGLKGVHWAEVNAATAQVLVIFDEDAVNLPGLVETIESVEQAHGTQDDTFDWSAPPHPADDGPLLSAAAVLGADAIGITAASLSRFLRWPTIPPAIRAPIVAVEGQPRLRRAVIGRFGPVGGDLLLALGNVLAHGVSQGPAPLAVDAVWRLIQVGELRSRRAVWTREEAALHSTGHALPGESHVHRPRPVPLPPGPVERAATGTSLAALAGATTVLAWTRDPGEAAAMILATAPKAARLGREAFAGVLGMELARRGVVPLDGAALRRLDRVTAIVVNSAVLCAPGPRILSAVAGGDPDHAVADWQAAERVLSAHTLAGLAGPGPWAHDGWRLARPAAGPAGDVTGPAGLTLDLLDHAGRRRAGFLIGCELDFRAEALLGAARECAERVLLTQHASTAELAAWADEVLTGARPLAGHVRRLQVGGHGVLLVCTGHPEALAAADVGVGVVTDADGVSWAADLVCGPGLVDAWRLLRAVGAAHRASRNAARLSLGGSALGALLVTAGRGPRRTRIGIAPVQSAALLAMASGTMAARSVGRAPAPAPVPRGDWHALTADTTLARLHPHRQLAQAPSAGGQGGSGTQLPGTGPQSTGPQSTGLLSTGPLSTGRAVLAAAASHPLAATAIIGPARGAAELAGAVRQELQDPLTPVLALGTMASAVVGSGVDAAMVAGVMAGNALISGAQRMRAERSLGRLLLSEQPTARRADWTPSGRQREPGTFPGLTRAPQQTVPADELSPGDVIALEPADVVPADARLLAADSLEVDESTLTGESLPVAKSVDPVPGAPLAERTCMVYEGSTILAGHGFAVVVATGAATEAGRAAMAAGRGAPATGIQARLADLTKISVPASGLGGLAVAGLGLLRGVPLREAVASGVAVAVAAVPEGLPLVATVAQLAAARRAHRDRSAGPVLPGAGSLGPGGHHLLRQNGHADPGAAHRHRAGRPGHPGALWHPAGPAPAPGRGPGQPARQQRGAAGAGARHRPGGAGIGPCPGWW